ETAAAEDVVAVPTADGEPLRGRCRGQRVVPRAEREGEELERRVGERRRPVALQRRGAERERVADGGSVVGDVERVVARVPLHRQRAREAVEGVEGRVRA